MRTVVLSRSRVFSGPLVLVNSSHPLISHTSENLSPVDSLHPHILLDSRASNLLSACIQKSGGHGSIVPVSGYRSQEKQQQIWDDTLAKQGLDFTKQYVARPGCSEHQTGFAIDLAAAADEIDPICPYFPDTGSCGEFRRLAAQYGFIQRYRRGKESLTEISEEPWHFRYVGAPHAQLIESNGLCLEEYSAFLRQKERVVYLPGGISVLVRYIHCAGLETVLHLPCECCQISGDNQEGFILTCWGCGI